MKTADDLRAIAHLQNSKTKAQLILDLMEQAAQRGEYAYHINIWPDDDETLEAFEFLGFNITGRRTHPGLRAVTIDWYSKEVREAVKKSTK